MKKRRIFSSFFELQEIPLESCNSKKCTSCKYAQLAKMKLSLRELLARGGAVG